MSRNRTLQVVLLVALVLGSALPLGATTLIRQSLDGLVAANEMILVGEVIDTFSYWNDEGSFILTDVRVVASEVLKGHLEGDEVTVTLMGGTVRDLSTIIVGGATLEPGSSYVLFLNRDDLPGAPAVHTVRDHVQGAFDLYPVGDELRAVSQANGHPLLPDSLGYTDAAGGEEGYPLDAMVDTLREIVEFAAKKEAVDVR